MFVQLPLFGEAELAPAARPHRPSGGAARASAPRRGAFVGPRLVHHSLFFAITLDADEAARLHAHGAELDRSLAVGGKPLEPERLHVTLRRMADYDLDAFPEHDVARWCRAASTLRCPPFEVVFDQAATFGGKGRPLVLKAAGDVGAAGVLQLHRALGIALANFGEDPRERPITPHMTLSYGGKPVPETAVEPVAWTARELVLVDSHVGQHLHEVRGRWALQG